MESLRCGWIGEDRPVFVGVLALRRWVLLVLVRVSELVGSRQVVGVLLLSILLLVLLTLSTLLEELEGSESE